MVDPFGPPLRRAGHLNRIRREDYATGMQYADAVLKAALAARDEWTAKLAAELEKDFAILVKHAEVFKVLKAPTDAEREAMYQLLVLYYAKYPRTQPSLAEMRGVLYGEGF